MGVKNKQRRAAKKRARDRRAGSPRDDRLHGPGCACHLFEPVLTADDVRELLLDVVAQVQQDSGAAERCARLLLAPGRPLTPEIVRAGVRALLADLIRAVTTNGWSPSDVAAITARLGSPEHVPPAVRLLRDDATRYAADQLPAAWSAELRDAGADRALILDSAPGLQEALELAAVLAQLPAIPPVLPAPGSRAPDASVAPADARLLARVQALLAKAEATEFDEEAEALSAKAQELVSRHALDRLLERHARAGPEQQPATRRLWLDAPYVFPKGMLVHHVAEANRSRSVISERLGFCTLVGQPEDLEGVALLVASLLVQAQAALSRCGRVRDARGASRTRSFRQSFLLSYAARIGERLREADDSMRAASGHGGELVPLLRRHREQLDARCEELFPHLFSKAGTIGNAEGWAAGRAAADGALLGPDLQVTAAAG